MATETLSAEDKEFLALCEEQFKHRYTDKDEEFMKVHNAELSAPPIVETWWVSQNSGRRNDRRYNRRSHPYERQDRGHDRGHERDRDHDRRSGHNDYNDRRHGNNYRSRYY